jgi:Zn-dependent peptidase ImmA (M78 family)
VLAVLQQTLRTIEKVGEMSFVTCDIEQEEEADWLGGCLLLPRTVLLQAAKQGKTAEKIAKEYETSEQMARFRLNASGVLVQVGRAKAARQKQARLSRAYYRWYTPYVPQEIHHTVSHRRDKDCQCPQLRPLAR